jgi:hypothetical protein
MFGLDVEGRYLNDATFHRVVDQMRALLSAYHITPHELREAAILAATMHETERIRPLFISPSPFGGMVFVDEAKDIPPAMFGELSLDNTNRTATGSTVGISRIGSTVGGSVGGRFSSDGTTVTLVDKGSFRCICGLSEHPNRSKHTHTCNDSNWVFYHPKTTPTPQCDGLPPKQLGIKVRNAVVALRKGDKPSADRDIVELASRMLELKALGAMYDQDFEDIYAGTDGFDQELLHGVLVKTLESHKQLKGGNEHCHLFVGTGNGYSVCNDCGMSDVYYNWVYNNPNRGLGATPPKDRIIKKGMA